MEIVSTNWTRVKFNSIFYTEFGVLYQKKKFPYLYILLRVGYQDPDTNYLDNRICKQIE